MSKTESVRLDDHGGLRVARVLGDLDLRTCRGFEAEVATEVAAGAPGALAVDLSDCDFLDSSGIARLLHVAELARDADIPFAVVCSSEAQPCRVLKMTRCIPARLRWFEDLEAAEAALLSPAGRPFRLTSMMTVAGLRAG
jgi:anti-anti-sigma factor